MAYTQQHYRDFAALLAAQRAEHGPSPALNQITAAITKLFADDSPRFRADLFGQAARGHVAPTARPKPRRRTSDRSEPPANHTSPGDFAEGTDWHQALRNRQPFRDGQLTGEAVIPHNQSTEYARWSRGSGTRLMAGQSGGGTILAMPLDGGASGQPALGHLDPAPAFAMALNEASYIVRSHGTVIAWFLGPEVYGAGETGEWVQTSERVNDEWSGAAEHPEIVPDQNRVRIALRGQP